jgi:hypothetical protein
MCCWDSITSCCDSNTSYLLSFKCWWEKSRDHARFTVLPHRIDVFQIAGIFTRQVKVWAELEYLFYVNFNLHFELPVGGRARGTYNIVHTIHLQNVYSQNVSSRNVYFTKLILTKYILMQRILSLNVYSTEGILNIYSRIFSLWCSIHCRFKKSSHWKIFMEAAARAALSCDSSYG